MTLTLAAAQYDIGFFQHFDDFGNKLADWFSQAKAQGAELLVFPEYASMELSSFFGEAVYADLNKQLYAMQSVYQDYRACYLQLAKTHNVFVLAGSFPLLIGDTTFRNRAELFSPEGSVGYQDKLIMTRFENEKWLIQPGKDLAVFNTDIGTLGINICYDSEFPMFARQQAEAGAELILVPSCTDGQAGFNRVKVGCQARALENQCFVLQSPTVGDAPWSPAVDCNAGKAAIYAPIERGISDNGIVAQGENEQAQWVYASVDLSDVARLRQEAQVLNYRDWPKQFLLSQGA